MSIPKICGFNKTSEAGVKVFAPSIFLQGCNMKCPYCMNSTLAKCKVKSDGVPLEKVDRFVEEEKPEMIMISGGEPLLSPNLSKLINHFRRKGLKIGLSTNGILVGELNKIIPSLSYVALDIKSLDPNLYESITIGDDFNPFAYVMQSLNILRKAKYNRGVFDYEIRTTLYPPYVNEVTINEIGQILEDGERWVLQQYRPTKKMYDMEATEGVEPYSYEQFQKLGEIARTYTKEAHSRYV